MELDSLNQSQAGVVIEIEGKEAAIRLNYPPSNIFDFELMQQFNTALDQVSAFPLLIISSSLDHFSLGVDIKIHTPALSPKMLKNFHSIIRKLYNHNGITVSVLNGYALGGGMELPLVCDFIFAHKESLLGFPEIRLACFPPVASLLLPRKIGGRASSYLYTGKLIDASLAEEIGVIEGVFSNTPDELIDTIRQHSLSSMSLLKKVLRRTCGFDFEAELAKAEKIYLQELVETEDMPEGISAFLEKRPPRFKNH